MDNSKFHPNPLVDSIAGQDGRPHPADEDLDQVEFISIDADTKDYSQETTAPPNRTESSTEYVEVETLDPETGEFEDTTIIPNAVPSPELNEQTDLYGNHNITQPDGQVVNTGATQYDTVPGQQAMRESGDLEDPFEEDFIVSQTFWPADDQIAFSDLSTDPDDEELIATGAFVPYTETEKEFLPPGAYSTPAFEELVFERFPVEEPEPLEETDNLASVPEQPQAEQSPKQQPPSALTGEELAYASRAKLAGWKDDAAISRTRTPSLEKIEHIDAQPYPKRMFRGHFDYDAYMCRDCNLSDPGLDAQDYYGRSAGDQPLDYNSAPYTPASGQGDDFRAPGRRSRASVLDDGKDRKKRRFFQREPEPVQPAAVQTPRTPPAEAGVCCYSEPSQPDPAAERVIYGENTTWTSDMSEQERSEGLAGVIDTSAKDVNQPSSAGTRGYTAPTLLDDLAGDQVVYGETTTWTNDMTEEEKSEGIRDEIQRMRRPSFWKGLTNGNNYKRKRKR